MKYCPDCKENKPHNEFYYNKDKRGILRYSTRCKKHNYILYRKNQLEYTILTFNHYGYMCQCCKIIYAREFLTLDHINGDGARAKKEKWKTGGGNAVNLIGWKNIKNKNFPTNLQTLCWNCNCAKGINQYCPHQINY